MNSNSARALSLVLLLLVMSQVQAMPAATRDLVGEWTFDDPDTLLAASVGSPLELVGTHLPVDGPEPDDGAVAIGSGSFYRCFHDIHPNGDGDPAMVNRYSLIMDVRIPELDSGYSLHQTDYTNAGDADWSVDPDGRIGTEETGYSSYLMIPGEWYRLAISVNLGEHYDYYLDGHHLLDGGLLIIDGRFALSPPDSAGQVLFFADDDGEDNLMDVANIRLYDHDLTAAEMADLGGFGHTIALPSDSEMEPYLQTPTASSIHINWHTASGMESVVEYGLDQELGSLVTGSSQIMGGETIWHDVTLTGLEPGTEYFYRCVTDTAQTDTFRFRTQPADDDDTGHFRFVVYGDSRSDVATHTAVIEAMQAKVTELYGEDLHSQLNLVLNVGDIVGTGSVLSKYRREYFEPIAPISSGVPFMISIGNHEGEADHYYNYMKYEDFAGTEGERYYAFRSGPVRFIILNSNTKGDTQIAWLAGELADAQGDPTTDWVFVLTHYPGRSEIRPSGDKIWVQDEVIPLLVQHDKVAGIFNGHVHAYEHGVAPGSNLRLLISGGGGSELDRWGENDNQTDHLEIHRTHDYYCYTVFDIDCANRSYTAGSYSLGNPDRAMANELFDSFSRELDGARPPYPGALAPIVEGLPTPCLTASHYMGERPIMSSRFQLVAQDGDWEAALVDSVRNWENIFGDSGEPEWLPVDLNDGIALNRLTLPPGVLTLGESYQWRVSYRDQNLRWSDWSARKVFTATELPDLANFRGDPRTGFAPLTVHFTDLSCGEPLAWDWDFDGDGETDSHERDPVWIYPTGGDWTVSLTVHFSAESITKTRINYISVTPDLTGLEATAAAAVTLERCRPNPFNPTTEIGFTLVRPGPVTLEIFDPQGRQVRRLVSGDLQAGAHRRSWDGRNDRGSELPSGLYLIRLKIGDGIFTQKAMLLK
jgi:acid phosphatase type 7